MIEDSNWIRAEEKLPGDPGFYLVKVGAPIKPIRIYEYKPRVLWEREDRNLWQGEAKEYVYNWFVEYWMHLPGLPEEET